MMSNLLGTIRNEKKNLNKNKKTLFSLDRKAQSGHWSRERHQCEGRPRIYFEGSFYWNTQTDGQMDAGWRRC